MSERRVGRLLLEVFRQWQRLHLRDLAPMNLGSGQVVLLMIVMESPGISQDSLCAQAGIDKTTAAKALKKLENSGYLFRERCMDDKRRNRLTPTPEALSLRPEMEQMARKHTEILLQGFLGNEIDRTVGYLSRMLANLRRDLNAGTSSPATQRKPTAWD